MYKIDRRGGGSGGPGPKNRFLGNYLFCLKQIFSLNMCKTEDTYFLGFYLNKIVPNWLNHLN